MSRLPRILLIACLAAVGVAAPASAAQPVEYDVNAFVFLKGTASGSDGDGWGSSSSWEAEIDQLIKNVPATDDQDSIVAVPVHHRIYANRLKQDYSLATAMGTITWGCAENGAPTGAPGAVTMTRQGDTYRVELSVAESLTQPRNCTGFSSWADSITIAPSPALIQFSVPVETLEKEGHYSHSPDVTLPCGEWTIYQTACNLRLQGSVSIARRSLAPPKDEKPVKKVTVRALPKDKGAEVKVTCGSACAGKISATAVATKRLKEKQVGQKTFERTSPGTQKVQIIYGNKRAVRQRGSVIINVRSGGKVIKTARLH